MQDVILTAGKAYNLSIQSQGEGTLYAWVDWNQNGTFEDSETITEQGVLITEKSTTLHYTVPENAAAGITYARFRYSSDPAASSPIGQAANGEVEDYLIEILPPVFDFGDAPNSYGTSLANNGARHKEAGNLYLGNNIDYEADAHLFPDMDDYNNIDDEDGVMFASMTVGQEASITVTPSDMGYINAWIDWNANGWFDNNEHIISGELVLDEPISLLFDVPDNISAGDTWARIRISSNPHLSARGEASDGEVEDYPIKVYPKPVTVRKPPLFNAHFEQKQAYAGTSTLYSHVYLANGDGVVTFDSQLGRQVTDGWNYQFYLDNNCNEQLDPEDYSPPLAMSMNVVDGDKFCIINRVTSPSNALHNERYFITTTASLVYTDTSRPDSILTIRDLTIALVPAPPGLKSSALVLTKTVENITQGTAEEKINNGKPGDHLVYRVYFANNGTGTITDVVINDSVPAYTELVTNTQQCTDIPSSITCTPSQNSNELVWTLAEPLNGGQQDHVSFEVIID